jgi:hypothetical protein
MNEPWTPGPWEFSDSSDVRGHKGEFRARSPYNGFLLVGPWVNPADLRLIAAAPEMAEALAQVEQLATLAFRGTVSKETLHYVVRPVLARICGDA